MIKRRTFLASTVAMATFAALPSVGAAACATERACVMSLMAASIASPSRPLPETLQGDTHLALTGDRLKDLHLIEDLLRHSDAVRLSLDAADWVIVELALARSGRPYSLQPAVQPVGGGNIAGLTDVSLSPFVIGA